MAPNQQMNFDQLMQSVGLAVGQSRQALAQSQQLNQQLRSEVARLSQNAIDLQQALARLTMERGPSDPAIQRVENIPGRRIPFDLLVDIPIPASASGTLTGSITISQEGPFVAVARTASLLSAYSFTTTDQQGKVNRFQGRSFGRYRPIHSAWDLNDGIARSQITMPIDPATNTTQAFLDRVSNSSPFRTMEGDFRVLFQNEGSSFPRQNIEVPSTMWTRSINEPWELGALDFFERGEVFQFKIMPMHPANPPYGNVYGFGTNDFPYPDSQWDGVEGVLDPPQQTGDTDPISRQPDAILTIGFHGYRIVQPPGVMR